MSPLDAVLDRPVSASAATAFLASSQLRVLVADDQRDVVEALRLLLSTHGLAVVSALTPAEALAHTSPVDAALIDLNYDLGRTSGEQGLDLVTALQGRHPGLPIVAMTAWSNGEIANEAMRRGARDFVGSRGTTRSSSSPCALRRSSVEPCDGSRSSKPR